MAQVGYTAAESLLERLRGEGGLAAQVQELAQVEEVALPPIAPGQMASKNVAADLVERSVEIKYPFVCVYCEKIANTRKERFRKFSGKAHLVVEVRLSQDRLDGLERNLLLYADAVTQVLERARGDWGNGMFYGGGYEAAFGPVRHGGRNFIQIAKVSVQIDVAAD